VAPGLAELLVGREFRGRSREAETLLVFGRSVETANFFNIWKCKKNHRYLCCPAKMTFNKSHFGMYGYQRTLYHHQNFSWGTIGAARARARAQEATASLPRLFFGVARGSILLGSSTSLNF